jgi:hypothetical protein
MPYGSNPITPPEADLQKLAFKSQSWHLSSEVACMVYNHGKNIAPPQASKPTLCPSNSFLRVNPKGENHYKKKGYSYD